MSLKDLTPEQREQARQAGAARKLAMSSLKELANLLPEGASPSQRALMLDRLSEMPVSYRNTYLKALRGRSVKAAIRANCCMCVGWDNTKDEIRNCTDPACPLYPYRPYRPK